MRNIVLSYFVIVIALALFSCGDGNYSSVSLQGYIKDSENQEVVENAKVSVVCWVYDTELWESREVKKETYSGKDGFYSLNFDKGEAMDIRVSSDKFESKEVSITLKKSKNEMDILLNKNE